MSVEIAGVSQTRTLRRLANGDEAVSIPIPYKISRLHGIKPNMLCKYLLIFPELSQADENQFGKIFNLFKDEKKEEYGYYLIQQRLGGINGRWEEGEQRKEFIDNITGIIEYCSERDITVRCIGVKENGKIKKQLWVHYSREDNEEAKIEAQRRIHQMELTTWEDFLKIIMKIQVELKKSNAITSEDEISKMLKTQAQRIEELQANLKNQQEARKDISKI